jgi:hypothetical protein
MLAGLGQEIGFLRWIARPRMPNHHYFKATLDAGWRRQLQLEVETENPERV